MSAHLRTLLRFQARQVRNSFRSDARGRRRLLVSLCILPLFALSLLVATRHLVTASGLLELYALGELSELAQRSATNLTLEGLSVSATITFVILCLGSVDQAYETLYQSRDTILLLSAPIPRSALFGYRLLLNLRWDAIMVLVMALPIWVGFGIWLRAPLLFYLALPVGWLLLMLIVSGIGTALAMLLTRWIPPSRLRQVMVTFMMVIGFSLVAGLQALITGLLTRDGMVQLMQANMLTRQGWLPSVWLSRCLGALLIGEPLTALPWFLALFGGAALCLYLAYRTAMRSYTIGWSNAQDSGEAAKPDRRQPQFSTRRTPMLAVVHKDLLLFMRQPAQWYQAALGTLAIAMVLVNYVGQERDAAGGLMIALVMSYVGASTFAMNLSLKAFSNEGKSWWLLQSAPLSDRQLFRAKLLMAGAPTATYALLALLIMQRILAVPWGYALASLPVCLVMVAGMICADVAIGLWRADLQAPVSRNADPVAALVSQGVNYFMLAPAILLLALPPVLAARGIDVPLAALLALTGGIAVLESGLAMLLSRRLALGILRALRHGEPIPSLGRLLRRADKTN